MRKVLICALALVLLLPATAFAAADSDKYSGFIGNLPDTIKGAIATETILLDIQANDGTSKTFGVKTEKGAVKEYQEGAYTDSTIAIHISENVMEKMGSSTDPISIVKDEWGTGIRLEGLTLGNKIKLFFVDISARIFFFFGGGGTGSGGGAGSGGLPGGGQPPVLPIPKTETSCFDNIDNDADGALDCQDNDCRGKACTNINVACQAGAVGGGPSKVCSNAACNAVVDICKETNCADGNDNDADGNADCMDADCNAQTCKLTQPPAGAVGPVRTDTCVNRVCKASVNQWTEINCNDGIDNDQDGGADVADYDCPYVDLKPTKVEYLGIVVVNISFNAYNHKVYFKNVGTAATNGKQFTMQLWDDSDNYMGACNYAAVLNADTEGSCTIQATTKPASVKLKVDIFNAQPEVNKNNNAATLTVV